MDPQNLRTLLPVRLVESSDQTAFPVNTGDAWLVPSSFPDSRNVHLISKSPTFKVPRHSYTSEGDFESLLIRMLDCADHYRSKLQGVVEGGYSIARCLAERILETLQESLSIKLTRVLVHSDNLVASRSYFPKDIEVFHTRHILFSQIYGLGEETGFFTVDSDGRYGVSVNARPGLTSIVSAY
jgi:hypothetical protein